MPWYAFRLFYSFLMMYAYVFKKQIVLLKIKKFSKPSEKSDELCQKLVKMIDCVCGNNFEKDIECNLFSIHTASKKYNDACCTASSAQKKFD